ncbi:MAG: cellulose synthase catalytic subunit [Pseudomonadota bacterium]
MGFYFDKFEDRRPQDPVPYSAGRELLWQFLATVNLTLGAWYIHWRWTDSLNFDALWFAIPLVIAETCAYIGLLLFTFNLWKTRDTPKQAPPRSVSEVSEELIGGDRDLSVDVFFPTYDEEPELVRLSIADAKRVRYPHDIDIKIHVLDDGKREEMKAVAEEEGVNYITRESNIGFKAGNMRNAMEQTTGDFIVICDADTRPFPSILENTLGYFRDPKVAWVQTPQWFYDIPEGQPLEEYLRGYLGFVGVGIAKIYQLFMGRTTVGYDPFDNDPAMFYDVLQRRRNWCNASFCCGAGSIHRRDAVMEAALKAYALQVSKEADDLSAEIEDESIRGDFEDMVTQQAAIETEFTPYKFHVSEDIYTSMVLHSDRDRGWKSVFHPKIESKMLSPQDLETWIIQRFKYAGGTIDICKNDNPLLESGFSIKQRLMYAATMWSYFGGIWNIIFLLSPIIFMFTLVAPVHAYTMDFFLHILPFIFANELAFMVGTWGISGYKGKATYLAFFPINLKAIWTVLKGEQIKFPTTAKERQEGNFAKHAIPQMTIVALTLAGIAFVWTGYVNGWHTNLSGAIANTFWGLNNVVAMSGWISSAFWQPPAEDSSDALDGGATTSTQETGLAGAAT